MGSTWVNQSLFSGAGDVILGLTTFDEKVHFKGQIPTRCIQITCLKAGVLKLEQTLDFPGGLSISVLDCTP